MAKNEVKFDEGTFCWLDLSTTDLNGAKKFYGGLFGWTFKDIPMGNDGEVYAIASIKGNDICGLSKATQDGPGAQGRTHWNSYVSVHNVDQIFGRAKELKAKALMPPADVMNAGRMAIVQDPTGAPICFWQPKEAIGNQADPWAPGSACWYELYTTDIDLAGKFYCDLLGWTIKSGNLTDHKYYEISKQKKAFGGMMALPKEMQGTPSHWLNYFAVSDCQGSTQKATQLGARVLMKPKTIPEVGMFAAFQDPQNGPFAIFESAKMVRR